MHEAMPVSGMTNRAKPVRLIFARNGRCIRRLAILPGALV